MTGDLTTLEKIRKLPWQYTGNALNVIFWFTAAYGSVFILFLNELGFDKARIGLIVSLLPFCGLLALLVAPLTESFGFKRTFLLFYFFRILCAGAFLFTPLIYSHYGQNATFLWVACAVLAFACCRAIAETAVFPWAQEMIPNSIRGKFSGINNFLSMVVSIITIAAAGFAVRRWPGINTFIFLISIGIIAAFVTLWCWSFIPGGAPVKSSRPYTSHYSGMWESLKDPNYRRFMIGLAVVSIPSLAMQAFLPIYMKEQIGMAAGLVIWLDIGGFIGGMLLGYIWGWAADRYGSKPVMLFGICLWMVLPIVCFLMPRGETAVIAGFCATFLMGMANIAWAIGFNRYLNVSAVPIQKKTAYMAVFYACVGLGSAVGPLLGGLLLKSSSHINGQFLFFKFDQFTPLWISATLVFICGALILSKVRADGAMPMRKFVGMFFQGNPLTAAGSIMRYYRAADEQQRVSITEQLGYSSSPMSNTELMEALNDPSFNVRYEAIIAIGHMKPSAQLVDALLLVLGGNEPDLSAHAAWALGKLGDKSAIIPLREMLNGDLPILRARSARALATLADTGSIPQIIELFRVELNPGLKIAYAQALGKMRSAAVLDEMLDFFQSLTDEMLRNEMALALVRIVGDESRYIYLWRQLRFDFSTAAGQQMLVIRKEMAAIEKAHPEMVTLAESAALDFAKDDIQNGLKLMINLIRALPYESQNPVSSILSHCCAFLQSQGASRNEYILLALYCLEEAIKNTESLPARPNQSILGRAAAIITQ
ncbi:MAG: hypothetical protein A2Y07_02140 [Planctomycetes bacterium GWF2_50_10]|nr:MAG: hypothetical protein A2Y07_02140 [Planctomycetes bacterium GWF2_50_10]